MKKKLITTVGLLFIMSISTGIYNVALSKNATLYRISQTNTQNQTKKETKTKPQNQKTQTQQTAQNPINSQTKAINTTPLAIVANPEKFLNKTVKMQATFDKFSTLGLDYSKALRKSSDYIGVLIQRDDVADHIIPLSEMKLFLTKSMAEKHIDLDSGDKIEITANVFSNALNDPWLDIKELKVLSKAKKEEKQQQ